MLYVHRSRYENLLHTEVCDSTVYVLRALGYSNLFAYRAALTTGTSAIAAEALEERGFASCSSSQSARLKALHAQAVTLPARIPHNEDGNGPFVPYEIPTIVPVANRD